MQTFPNLNDLLLTLAGASVAVTVITNGISYATGYKPNWLSLVVAVIFMVIGYIVIGKTTPAELFAAVVYAFIVVTPLAHLDGAMFSKLMTPSKETMRVVGERDQGFWQKWI